MYEDFPWVFVMDAAYKAVKDPVKIIVNIVKLRKREGQGVDPGRSLKGHS